VDGGNREISRRGGENESCCQRVLLKKEEQVGVGRKDARRRRAAAGREAEMHIVMEVKSNSDLLEAALAGSSARRFARGLDCWQEQSSQHTDNCQDDQQLDKGQCSAGHEPPLR
jgi:hypothetical protein